MPKPVAPAHAVSHHTQRAGPYGLPSGVTQLRLDWFVGQGFPACLDSLERPSHSQHTGRKSSA